MPGFHPSFRTPHPEYTRFSTVLTDVDTDHSGTKTYRINALGFRGRDFNPAAKRHVFVFGCSYTYGTGLNEEEIWAHHVHRAFCELHGLEPEEVNLMNFGISGASNQEIARMVMLECSVVTPDLVVVQFTHPERCELVFDDDILAVSPSLPDAEWVAPDRREAAADFYRHYRDEHGGFDLLLQMVHTQHFLGVKGIEYVTVMAQSPEKLTRPGRALLRLLDPRRTLRLPRALKRLEQRRELIWWREPKAADNLHYGATIHRTAAELVWRRYLWNRRPA